MPDELDDLLKPENFASGEEYAEACDQIIRQHQATHSSGRCRACDSVIGWGFGTCSGKHDWFCFDCNNQMDFVGKSNIDLVYRCPKCSKKKGNGQSY